MTTAIKSFSALFLTTAFLTTGAGLLSSLLSINMSLHGYSETMIGLVMSGNYVGFVLGIFLCQPVVQRVGHIRAFATFAAVITVTAMLYGMFLSALFWGVLRILNGLSVTGMFMVIE
ncbi:MAG: MFS transporter, partial [Deltaproteobacteria bacterium]|nr:MFS transporter [Deltaproteobacteria bacterium]